MGDFIEDYNGELINKNFIKSFRLSDLPLFLAYETDCRRRGLIRFNTMEEMDAFIYELTKQPTTK